jgi:hypothetical protein
LQEGFSLENCETKRWWRVAHAACYLLGGTLFSVATSIFQSAADAQSAEEAKVLGNDSAIIYVVGALGLVIVDWLEYVTYVNDVPLRNCLLCSLVGSGLYLVGSIGFLSGPHAVTPLIGILGFLVGSVCIMGSKAWRVHRILATEHGERRGLLAGVEAQAFVGAFLFLVGICVYWVDPTYSMVLDLWSYGSGMFLSAGISVIFTYHPSFSK